MLIAHPSSFWTNLGVNYRKIQDDFVKSPEALFSSLRASRALPLSSFLTIAKVCGLRYKKQEKKEILTKLLRKPDLFTEVYALSDFYKNCRRKYVITQYAKRHNLINNIVYPTETKRKTGKTIDNFALLILVAQYDDRLLKEIQLMDSVNLSGFVDMELVQAGDLQLPRLDAEIVEKTIKGFLDEFETEMGEGKESAYEETLPRDDEVFVFLRRQIKEEMVMEARRHIPVKPAERIIFHFSEGGKRLRLASRTRRASKKLLDKFTERCFGSNYHYLKSTSKIKVAELEKFVERAIGAKDHIPIMEIEVVQAPLQGSPTIKLSQLADVTPAIRDLEKRNIPLLRDIKKISSFAVNYKGTKVRLQVIKAKTGKHFELLYSDYRLPETEREPFEDLMRKEYGIPVRSKG